MWQPIATHGTEWNPDSVQPTLNVELDACFQLSPGGGTRLDMAHLVVLDGFFDEPMRAALLDAITEPGWDHAQGPPPAKWQRATADTPQHARTWGLRHEELVKLEEGQLHAKVEVQSRLAALYPEVTIMHQPSDAIQSSAAPAPQQQQPEQQGGERATAAGGRDERATSSSQGNGPHPPGLLSAQEPQGDYGSEQEDSDEGDGGGGGGGGGGRYDCHAMLANAAVHGHEFGWHQDADPQTFPLSSAFTRQYGQYANREPGKPLFVSLLLYLNAPPWPRDWAADTLFLDTGTETGILVRPKPYRAVLMDQDVLHRLSPPSSLAAGHPRYSLVWKLVFVPRVPGQQCSLAREEWGTPAAFGSAAKVRALARQLARQQDAALPAPKRARPTAT